MGRWFLSQVFSRGSCVKVWSPAAGAGGRWSLLKRQGLGEGKEAADVMALRRISVLGPSSSLSTACPLWSKELCCSTHDNLLCCSLQKCDHISMDWKLLNSLLADLYQLFYPRNSYPIKINVHSLNMVKSHEIILWEKHWKQ